MGGAEFGLTDFAPAYYLGGDSGFILSVSLNDNSTAAFTLRTVTEEPDLWRTPQSAVENWERFILLSAPKKRAFALK